jgi:hypothetical protein
VPAPFSTPELEDSKGAPEMSDTFIIEVSSQAAGIVVRNPGGFRFFAASPRFNAMEGRLFRNAREAERAAAGALRRRPGKGVRPHG